MQVGHRRLLLLGGALALALAVMFGIRAYFGATGKSPGGRNFDEPYLQGLAGKLNAKLPRMVSPEGRLDHVEAGPGKRVRFSYTLTGHDAAEIKELLTPDVIAQGRKAMCSVPDLAEAVADGVRMEAVYAGNDGKPAFEFVMNRGDCG